jgi:hypothetical protein
MATTQSMGGHFSAILEARQNRLPGTHGYESARSSLYVFLAAMRPKRIFIPNYICDAIPTAVIAAGVECIRYPINDQFQPASDLHLTTNDYILLVNYFGLCARGLFQSVEKQLTPQAILDCSQAYFFKDDRFTTTIYSPRKFLPVADGGFIATSQILPKSAPDNKGSIRRYQYLLERSLGEPESSRSAYLQAESELELLSNREISMFTRKVCETTDLDFIKNRRRENFAVLTNLDSDNSLQFDLGDQVPLCYPLMTDNADKIRERLLEKRIFTPRYWPNITPLNHFEEALLRKTVFLPVDHRYNRNQIQSMFQIVKQLLK